MHLELSKLGWNAELQHQLNELTGDSLEPARVAIEHKGSYRLLTAQGEIAGLIPGKMSYEATSRADLPAVGDWVGIEMIDEQRAVIRAILPRRSSFVRKVPGVEAEVQVIATNVEFVFIVDPFDRGPNLRRIERYLTVAWESGATPVVVLTKSDLVTDLGNELANVIGVAPGVEVFAVSSLTRGGIDDLARYFEGTPTTALLGPSGAGKSSLINAILGRDVMIAKEVRSDGKGRHTTTHRELIPLPNGGALIDTPGMRELQFYDGDEGIDASFSDIQALAEGCRFRDCAHDGEPGCAVAAALRDGTLNEARYESYRKQLREFAALERRKNVRLAREESRKMGRMYREALARSPKR